MWCLGSSSLQHLTCYVHTAHLQADIPACIYKRYRHVHVVLSNRPYSANGTTLFPEPAQVSVHLAPGSACMVLVQLCLCLLHSSTLSPGACALKASVSWHSTTSWLCIIYFELLELDKLTWLTYISKGVLLKQTCSHWSYQHLSSHLNPILRNWITWIQERWRKFFPYWTGKVSPAEPEFVTSGTKHTNNSG